VSVSLTERGNICKHSSNDDWAHVTFRNRQEATQKFT